MKYKGISLDIRGFGSRTIRTVVTDYTGTLSFDGKVAPGVKKRLRRLKELVDIVVITADPSGTAARQLGQIFDSNSLVMLKEKPRHDLQKLEYVMKLDIPGVAVFGNGYNDRFMLKTAKEGGGLAIAVDNGEGCAVEALVNAHLWVAGASNALDLLLERRCEATFRY